MMMIMLIIAESPQARRMIIAGMTRTSRHRAAFLIPNLKNHWQNSLMMKDRTAKSILFCNLNGIHFKFSPGLSLRLSG